MMVNGGQSVMIHGISTTQMLPAVNCASLELRTLQRSLDRDPVRYGWMMCNAGVVRQICIVAVTTDGARTTAVIVRMLG